MPKYLQLIGKPSILVYASLKFVLAGMFLLSLIQVTSASTKNELTCKGQDLIAQYEKSDPDLLHALRKKAEKTIFGNSRLWKISKPGVPDSWLFGTMHISSNNVVTLPAAAQLAFDKSDTLLVELSDVIDKKKLTATILKIKHLVYRLDGKTIKDDLDAKQMVKVAAAINARAMPFEVAIRMQPWILGPAITTQLCEVAAKKQGKKFLDAKLMLAAVKTGKQLISLETMEEQLNIMASLPRKFHISSLVESLALGDSLDDIKASMKSLYLKGQISMIVPLIKHVSKKTTNSDDYAQFLTKMLDQRNVNMAGRAGEYFSKGNVFMAVGALHLPGKNGVAALLARQGYSVSAVDISVVTD